jgi:hypothetical protein
MTTSVDDFVRNLVDYDETFNHSLEVGIRLKNWAASLKNYKSYNNFSQMLSENDSMKDLYFSQFDLSLTYMRSVRSAERTLLNETSSPESFINDLCSSETFKDISLWALFILVEKASFRFSDEFANKKRREEALTYSLIDRVGIEADNYQDIPYEVKKYIPAESGIKYLDLQINRRETKTGGDAVIFVEHRYQNLEYVVIPIVLQAKRYSDGVVDISYKPKDGDYQFFTLRDGKYPSAYLLFENNSEGHQSGFRPPLIKMVDDIECCSVPKTTSALENTQTLGSFILRILRTETKYIYKTPEDAVSSIISEININDIDTIAVFSTVENAGPRFQSAWDDHPEDRASVVS